MDLFRRLFTTPEATQKREQEGERNPTAADLYEFCFVPDYIAWHMYDVAAVTDYLKSLAVAKGYSLDERSLNQSALTHDIGNISKAYLEALKEAAVREGKPPDHYVNKREELEVQGIRSPDAATKFLLESLPDNWISIDPSTWILLDALSRYGEEGTNRFPILPGQRHDLEARILLAADGWVSPEGIVTPRRRAEELLLRPGYRENERLVLEMEIHKRNVEHLGSILGVTNLYDLDLKHVTNREKYMQAQF